MFENKENSNQVNKFSNDYEVKYLSDDPDNLEISAKKDQIKVSPRSWPTYVYTILILVEYLNSVSQFILM